MSANPHPWDPRDGEPPEAYARFLSYRNLGPGRSLALAESVHSGKRRQKASGNWFDDSAQYDWVSRAVAWDVHTLSAYGEELARLWVGILVAAARKCAQKLADPACVPKDFAQALAVVDRLAPYLTPDVLKALQPAVGPDAEPRAPAVADVE
jgi:hypothetical protein